MYLSRSQIINRDSVVWIERKKKRKNETAEWGRGAREWENVREAVMGWGQESENGR